MAEGDPQRQVLLTNDDGIDSPGISALYDALQGLGEILPVAPLSAQSATSHGITFTEPLMTEKVTVNDRMIGIGVDGRPADCVKLALRTIWPQHFGPGAGANLTISGMNVGANVGINVLYSGTVGAAMESAFLGVPAIAVSLEYEDRSRIHFARAAEIARAVIDRILASHVGGIEAHTVINVNIPRIESNDAPVPPIRVVDSYERRVNPFGQVYYWASGSGMEFTHTAPDTDVEALSERCVTVTPLTYVLTDHARLQAWKERLEK
ncbi:MAG: 5'/3'-nucleotidase SurE [Planctomycetota bacterium]|jgi:5'-nucleotidase